MELPNANCDRWLLFQTGGSRGGCGNEWATEDERHVMITLTKTIKRRLANGVVVEFGPNGIQLRRYRGRKKLQFSWEQIAALDPVKESMCRVAETRLGERVLAKLKT